MTAWDFLIDDAAIAAVVPEAYRRYRPAVRGALAIFLSGLSATRQAGLLTDQAALPPWTSPEERLATLARGCPTLHKLGQILARDRRLSPDLRGHLQGLESLPPTVSTEEVDAILREELGPLNELGVTLQPPALAEASVAVVVPFRDDREGRDGVFKILKPGVAARLDEELRILGDVGARLDARCDDLAIPRLDYEQTFSDVRESLLQELRLDLEQRHLVEARAFHRDERLVLVPEPFERLCTPRVTAMERVRGRKVTERPGDEARGLARLVASALIVRPIFSTVPDALFHGDPHAGNLMRADDGRLALLDWSLVGRLGRAEREAMAQAIVGAVSLDPARIAASLAGLSERGTADAVALRETAERGLRRLREGAMPGSAWLTALLDDATLNAGLRVSTDLVLFRKTLHTLDGVLADLGGGGDLIDANLLGGFVSRFAREWPRRWVSPPGTRDFATRLSNADLASLWFGLPLAAWRYWIGTAIDLCEPNRGRDA